MSTTKKRLLIALFFFVIAIISVISMINTGFDKSSALYTLIFITLSALFLKNALRP